jgi:hypothetical protein
MSTLWEVGQFYVVPKFSNPLFGFFLFLPLLGFHDCKCDFLHTVYICGQQYMKFSTFLSDLYSQIWLKSSCVWSPFNLPHKMGFLFPKPQTLVMDSWEAKQYAWVPKRKKKGGSKKHKQKLIPIRKSKSWEMMSQSKGRHVCL